MTGPTYCGRCGRALAEAGHETCLRQLELEPPRYCARCRRRLVVQVMPDRWVARCAEHGTTTADTWSD